MTYGNGPAPEDASGVNGANEPQQPALDPLENVAFEDPSGLDRTAYNAREYPLHSDKEMAQAAASVAMHDVKWAGGLGWRRYDQGTGAWSPLAEEMVVERVGRYMQTQAATCADMAGIEQRAGRDGAFWLGLSVRWEKAASASHIIQLAKILRGELSVDPERFDSHPDLWNCPNGVLDLCTQELRDHDPELYFTKCAGADYRPGAWHPDVVKALEAIPADVRPFAQLRYGQALTGYTPPDDQIVFGYGSGENGKGVIMNLIFKAAGKSSCSGYAALLPSHLLTGDPKAHTTDLMTLRSVRIGFTDELPEDGLISVHRIKVTTADDITARYIRQNNVTFRNECSQFVNSNLRPVIKETDHGTWRRLMTIPFPFTFRKAHEPLRDADDRHGDGTLRQRIAMEEPNGPRAQAMLAWMAEGARRWYAAEPGRPEKTMGEPPQRVRDAMDEWRDASDLFYSFARARAEFDQGSHVVSTDLRDIFNGWLVARGHRPWGMETFMERIKGHDLFREHGVTVGRLRTGQAGEPSRPGGQVCRPLGKQYTAVFGIRFASAESEEKAGQGMVVQGVQGSTDNPHARPSYRANVSTPAHPAHGISPYVWADANGNLVYNWAALHELAFRSQASL